MKNKVYKVLAFLILCFISFNMNVFASEFDTKILLENEISDDNTISIVLGYTGKNIMAIQNSVSYDDSMLELMAVSPLSDFVVTKSELYSSKNYTSFDLVADTNNTYVDMNYAVLTFQIKEKFVKGKYTKIFFYSYLSAGPYKDKYRNSGYYLDIKNDGGRYISYVRYTINKNTRLKIWFDDNLFFIVGFSILILLLIIILIRIPGLIIKYKEIDLERKIDRNRNDDIRPFRIKDSLGPNVKKESNIKDRIEIVPNNPFNSKPSEFEMPKLREEPKTYNFSPYNPEIQNRESTPEIVTIEPERENVEYCFSALNPTNVRTTPNHNNNNIQPLNQIIQGSFEPKEYNFNVLQSDGKDNDLMLFKPANIEDKDDNSHNNIGIFILMLLIPISLLGAAKVSAIDYKVQELRECIVGNQDCYEEYDYSGDGEFDVLDLIYTKDLESIADQIVPEDKITTSGTTRTTKVSKTTKDHLITTPSTTLTPPTPAPTTSQLVTNPTTRPTTVNGGMVTFNLYRRYTDNGNANNTKLNAKSAKYGSTGYTLSLDYLNGFKLDSIVCSNPTDSNAFTFTYNEIQVDRVLPKNGKSYDCSVNYVPEKYSVKFKYGQNTISINGKESYLAAYHTVVPISLSLNVNLSKVTCVSGSSKVEYSLTKKSTSEGYDYTFKFKQETTSPTVCNLS